MRVLHELKYLHLTTLPDGNDEDCGKMGIVKGISEFLWASPIHPGYELKNRNERIYNEEFFGSKTPYQLLIQAIVFGILGVTTYFKPKVGMGLAAATLCPKLYHRFIDKKSPTQFIPFSEERLTALTTVGHANYGRVYADGQMHLCKYMSYNIDFASETLQKIQKSGINESTVDAYRMEYSQIVVITQDESGQYQMHCNKLKGMKVLAGQVHKGIYCLEECTQQKHISRSDYLHIFCVPKNWTDEEVENYHKNPAAYNGEELVGYMKVFFPQTSNIT